MEAIAKIAKNRILYECKSCNYLTYNKYDFNKHNNTIKHKSVSESIAIDNLAMVCDKNRKNKEFICSDCNKGYKDNSGLWKHKKKCHSKLCSEITKEINPQITPELILNILEKNNELTNLLIEQNKTIMELSKNNQNQVINSSINSHNKSFNLQFFLNETCKDAMNITDFVDSIKLQLTDLENIGEMGYVKGISNIITSNLKALDVTQRPIHCTDKKRETLYIKDENKWEKEDEKKNKLRKAIKKIANKNISLIQEFKKKHPDCIKSTSRISDKYNKIIIEAMGGSGDNDEEKEDKIIKNISDVTIIDK